MTKTLEATYDGETLRPDEPLDLKPNTRVRVTIETTGEARLAALELLDALPGARLFKTSAEADRYLDKERDSWER
jgi:predicted DNA-binding antitoxin AbrB/MazE fold protein